MSAILFDLDGVLYEADRPIAGAAETVRWFQTQGIPYLFLTNTTSRSRQALADKLAGMGIDAGIEYFLTPPVAACQWLKQRGIERIALFVPDITRGEFSEFVCVEGDGEPVEAVVMGDLGSAWTFQALNRVFRLLNDKPDAVLVALGMTRYWRGENGLQLDVGPMVKAIEYATGKEPVVTGKPARTFFESARAMLGVEQAVVMIGDDIHGDVAAAQRAGIGGVLVKTGKFSPSDLDSKITPDAVLESVADLPAWWQRNRAVTG